MTELHTTHERHLTGRAASPGLVDGVLVVPTSKPSRARQSATPAQEAQALGDALAVASGEIMALMDAMEDPDAIAILEFQVALLEDQNLSDPAYQRVADGESADGAFSGVVAEMVADYRSANDDYFAARASDLEDLGARVVAILRGEIAQLTSLPTAGVLLADDLSPSGFLARDWSDGQGIALRAGSPGAHVAMLARARGVPMVVALGPLEANDGTPVLLDGEAGSLCLNPTDSRRQAFLQRQAAQQEIHRAEADAALQAATTRDGEPVSVQLNIAHPDELQALDPALCDGIGLVRTEFLFHDRRTLPGEDEQLAVYRRILGWAGNRPVTIRTLDAGGDKPVAGLTLEGEQNPFLGLRGVRLSLAHPEVFKIQLRALLQAACAGCLRIMIPMVSVPGEMDAVRELLAQCRGELAAAGRPLGEYQLGMMVEVPSAALALDTFETDFVSIGSNDLVQYLTAVSRDASELADLADPRNPAVLSTIARVLAVGHDRAIPVSLCGDAGADPLVLPALLALGLRSVSVNPPAVGRVKRIIAGWSSQDHG